MEVQIKMPIITKVLFHLKHSLFLNSSRVVLSISPQFREQQSSKKSRGGGITSPTLPTLFGRKITNRIRGMLGKVNKVDLYMIDTFLPFCLSCNNVLNRHWYILSVQHHI